MASIFYLAYLVSNYPWVALAQRTRMEPRSTSSAVTTHGPIGQNVSCDLPRNHCWCARCRSRAVTSFTMV